MGKKPKKPKYHFFEFWALGQLTPTDHTCGITTSDLCHLNKKRLVFITEMESVYSAVRTGSLNDAVCACATYSTNLLVFIAEMKSVYSAVRTGSLNEAACAPSYKG
jgi:hypothetical protein